jgi:hypothetical protein
LPLIAKNLMLDCNSNQLVLLRRIADNLLKTEERNIILNNVKELNRLSHESEINITALTFLLGNDPLEGTDTFRMFEGKNDSELVRLKEQYEK